jgi:glycosyltransferase involved in cell wall biosynthesis
MKIVYILPGSGGTFYCENCVRDIALVKALRQHGHDVVMVPLYLPVFSDDPDIAADIPMFFGGINAYLQQKIPLFRHTPRWIDKMFDSKWMINAAAKRAGSTRADGLGDMTVSMLRGPDGNQAKEVDRLVSWLEKETSPDIIHITNILLLGLAESLKEKLGAPIVCTTMDEDGWIDAMQETHREQCWSLLARHAGHVEAFVTASAYYANIIQDRLAVPIDRMRIIPIGVDVQEEVGRTVSDSPTIGYLTRMCESLGLGKLVDAFIDLKCGPNPIPGLRLRVMGGKTTDDERFIREQQAKLNAKGILGDAEFLDALDRDSRRAFLRTLTLLSVPMHQGEAFGSFIIEALAEGVPVIQPRVGGFIEVIQDTGGGILYDPNEADALTGALRNLLQDKEKARTLGENGQRRVARVYTIDRMVEQTEALYAGIVGDKK